MDAQSKRSSFEKTTLWALLGILATVGLGVPAVYFAIHEKRPHISYEIISKNQSHTNRTDGGALLSCLVEF
jgi:hypothetical protein